MGQAYCMQDHDVWFFFDGWPLCLVDWINTYRVNISIVWLSTHLPDGGLKTDGSNHVLTRIVFHISPICFCIFGEKPKMGQDTV
jgi:hypothetical protein